MKHLVKIFESQPIRFDDYFKTFKRVILPIEIINDLRDICLELQDIGFNIKIGGYVSHSEREYENPTEGDYTFIQIQGKFKIEIKNEIDEVLDHIRDYMTIYRYNTDIDKIRKSPNDIRYFITFRKK